MLPILPDSASDATGAGSRSFPRAGSDTHEGENKHIDTNATQHCLSRTDSENNGGRVCKQTRSRVSYCVARITA